MYTRIRERRKQLHMTQTDLANKTELKQAMISAVEIGRNEPSAKAIGKIAKALEVSTDWLIFGEKNEDTTNKPPARNFSKQQLELIEITDKMTDQQQTELLGAVKMFLIKL